MYARRSWGAYGAGNCVGREEVKELVATARQQYPDLYLGVEQMGESARWRFSMGSLLSHGRGMSPCGQGIPWPP